MKTVIFDQDLQTSLGSLPEDESMAWKRRLERHRADCGCRIGSLTMLCATAAWTGYSLLSQAAERHWQRCLWMGLLILLVSGVAGKIIGLAVARVRFNLTVRDLKSRTSAGRSCRQAPASIPKALFSPCQNSWTNSPRNPHSAASDPRQN